MISQMAWVLCILTAEQFTPRFVSETAVCICIEEGGMARRSKNLHSEDLHSLQSSTTTTGMTKPRENCEIGRRCSTSEKKNTCSIIVENLKKRDATREIHTN
jgi:CRISPR/Cas system-associated endoribonuclease Cas2